MKTESGKYFTLLSLLALLVACAPMDTLTSIQDIETRHATETSGDDVDHAALAREYEDLAREMQAKAQEQDEILDHKPRSGYFGKNGRDIKSHVAFKVRRYQQVAQESAERAAYHSKIAAEQTDRKSAARIEQADKKKNKVEGESKTTSSLAAMQDANGKI